MLLQIKKGLRRMLSLATHTRELEEEDNKGAVTQAQA